MLITNNKANLWKNEIGEKREFGIRFVHLKIVTLFNFVTFVLFATNRRSRTALDLAQFIDRLFFILHFCVECSEREKTHPYKRFSNCESTYLNQICIDKRLVIRQ